MIVSYFIMAMSLKRLVITHFISTLVLSSGRGRSSPRSGSPSSRGGVSYTDRSFDTTETLETTSNTTKTSLEREVSWLLYKHFAYFKRSDTYNNIKLSEWCLDKFAETIKWVFISQNHHLSLGVEVCVPGPPHNVHTASRRMARENTFRWVYCLIWLLHVIGNNML